MNDVNEVNVDVVDQTPRVSQGTGLGLGLGIYVPSSAVWIGGRAISEVDLTDLHDEEDFGTQVSAKSRLREKC